MAFSMALLLVRPLPAWQNAPPDIQKIKDQVNAIPIGGKLTVREQDGTEYHGNLQAIEADAFSIREVDLKQTLTIPYSSVDRISKNYGRKGFAGHRVNPKRSMIIGLVFVGVLLTVVFVAVAHDK